MSSCIADSILQILTAPRYNFHVTEDWDAEIEATQAAAADVNQSSKGVSVISTRNHSELSNCGVVGLSTVEHELTNLQLQQQAGTWTKDLTTPEHVKQSK